MLNDARGAEAQEAADESSAVKRLIKANPRVVREDPDLLAELGLRLDGANVIDFGPVALSRVNAAHQRESSERRRLESVARANFGAQAQTHAAVLDLLESEDHADLAARLDDLAKDRFGLTAGVLALEGPEPVPAGWRALARGQVDLALGEDAPTLMGHAPTALGLFAGRAPQIDSIALVRLRLWGDSRTGLVAFGSADPTAFTPDMGVDLLIFLSRIVELTAERWPSP